MKTPESATSMEIGKMLLPIVMMSLLEDIDILKTFSGFEQQMV
jgi:hypothetical protein